MSVAAIPNNNTQSPSHSGQGGGSFAYRTLRIPLQEKGRRRRPAQHAQYSRRRRPIQPRQIHRQPVQTGRVRCRCSVHCSAARQEYSRVRMHTRKQVRPSVQPPGREPIQQPWGNAQISRELFYLQTSHIGT